MTFRQAIDLVQEFAILDNNIFLSFSQHRDDPRYDKACEEMTLESKSPFEYALTDPQWGDDAPVTITKNTEFTHAEEMILCKIIAEINKVKNILTHGESRMVMKNIQLDAILLTISTLKGHDYRPIIDTDGRHVIIDHIIKMSEWAAQTYENNNISFALGIDLESTRRSSVTIKSLYEDAMLKVLSSGQETILVCNKYGEIINYERLEKCVDINAPLDYCRVGNWSVGKIAVALTPLGELLLFYDQHLLYLKRVGHWYHADASMFHFHLGEKYGYDPAMTTALLHSCLDVAFKRCGGCIGVVEEDCPIISAMDRYALSSTPRAVFFRQILGNKRFQDIDREMRLELLGIDGATVIDKTGNILAIGAILQVNPTALGERTAGGRSVAARHLAKYGIGVKISADGSIEAWKKDPHGVLEKFVDVM